MYVSRLKDTSHPIERLEVFEDRMGVRLQGLCVVQYWCWNEGGQRSDGWIEIEVNGELYPKDGTELQKNVWLVVNAYDSFDPAARVVATATEVVRADVCYGFQTFSVKVETPLSKLFRVRIYPRRPDY
jgi:hypothetical protein